MHDNFEDHDESIEYEIEVETDTEVQVIPDDGLVLARDMLPSRLPVIPLRPRPAFPGVIIPLTVTGKARVDTIKQAMETDSHAIGLVMVQELDEEDSASNLQRVGVAAKILKLIHTDGDSAHVLVNSLERFS
ncbi:MAG: endopeptidase La, partial [Desulfuromusa sp.]|nr:endopeptidase La [Desulfuromusa sp.]